MKNLCVNRIAVLALCGLLVAASAPLALPLPVDGQEPGSGDSSGLPTEAELAAKEQLAKDRQAAADRLGLLTLDLPRDKLKYVILDYRRHSLAEEKIRAALDMETTFEFLEVPLSDAVSYLKDLHGISIQFDSAAMKEAGVGEDTPVTRHLSGMPLREGLHYLLDDLDLDFIVRDEVLMITTPQRAEAWMETHVYEVRHLKRFTAEEVAAMIRTTIRPKSWRPAEDGEEKAASAPSATTDSTNAAKKSDDASKDEPPPRASIVSLNGALIVTQSQSGHAAVVDLLHQLALFDVNPYYK